MIGNLFVPLSPSGSPPTPDAALYRVYQHQAERIRTEGGQIQRVILDVELKKATNRELSKLNSLPESTRDQREQEIADQRGLTVVNGRIPIPDIQVEYEAPERELAGVNLELATAHYHRDGLAAKASAGFGHEPLWQKIIAGKGAPCPETRWQPCAALAPIAISGHSFEENLQPQHKRLTSCRHPL